MGDATEPTHVRIDGKPGIEFGSEWSISAQPGCDECGSVYATDYKPPARPAQFRILYDPSLDPTGEAWFDLRLLAHSFCTLPETAPTERVDEACS